MKDKCHTCKEEMINPKYILQEMSMVGFYPIEFCSKLCFVKYVLKNFKSTITSTIKRRQ